jgi:outer membrane lipoprotein-sorting protein
MFLAAALFLPLLLPAHSQTSSSTAVSPGKELSLHEIVDRANKALRGDTSHARLTMTITTPSWERRLDVEGWNRDRKLAFILIHAPPKDAGNVTLRRHSEMWAWLPRVERVIKVPPTMMHSSWQGSDFTYEDIVKADSIVKDYEHKLLGKTPEEGRTVYQIQAVPKPDAPVVWGQVLFWAAVYPGDEVVGLKEEDYSERGELIRTITLSDIKRMGGRLVPARLECLPHKKLGQKTTLQYHDIEFDIPLPDSFFSLSRLQKGVR